MSVADAVAVAILVTVAVVLMCGGIFVLALGASAWSRAISAAVNARLHGKQVDAFGKGPRIEAADDDEPEPEQPKLRGTRTSLVDINDDDLENAVRFGNVDPEEAARGEWEEYTTASARDEQRGRVRTMDENGGFDDEQPPVPGAPVIRAGA